MFPFKSVYIHPNFCSKITGLLTNILGTWFSLSFLHFLKKERFEIF